jgi:predicted nucleic-acid-binding protein
MQSIDTNVVVRLIVHDDEEQGRRAEAIFRRALDAGVYGSLR